MFELLGGDIDRTRRDVESAQRNVRRRLAKARSFSREEANGTLLLLNGRHFLRTKLQTGPGQLEQKIYFGLRVEC